MLATRPAPMTAGQFLQQFEGVNGKWELLDGVPVLMSGGSIRHAIVARNILLALGGKLRGTGCAPLGSDGGLKLDEHNVRYPDVAIYCDRRDLNLDDITTKAYQHPCVVFEVLSPSTTRYDRGRKSQDYNEIESVKLLVLVDPIARVFETYERVDTGAWAVTRHPPGSDLALTEPAITITADEMFADF